MIVNRLQLAAILECEPTTIGKMVDRGMPFVSAPRTRREEWQFSTKAAIEWLAGGSYLRGGDDSSAAAGQLRIEERREAMLARRVGRQLREHDLAERQRTTIHLDDMVMIFDEQNAVVKSRLQAIPPRLAQALSVESDPATVQKILENEIVDALQALSEEGARASALALEKPK